MSSPFKTSKEFLEADGPIYSFGGSPVIIGFFLVIGAIFLLWFIYASYTMKASKPKVSNPLLSLVIAASAFSVADSIHTSDREKTKHKPLKKAVVAETISSKPAQAWQVPIATAGLMLGSRSIVQRRSYKKSRRSFQHSSSIWKSLSHRLRAGLSLVLHSTCRSKRIK